MSIDSGGMVISRPAFKLTNPATFTLMSDLHLGAANINYKLIEKELQTAKEHGDRILLNGDIFDMILVKDAKRFSPDVLHPRLRGRRDLVNAAVEWGAELLGPYADLIDMIGVGNHECHDDQTEVLTDRGWMLFCDLTGNESLATMNLENSQVEYQIPSRIVSYPFKGNLTKIKSPRHMDAMITPNHRMTYRHTWSYNGKTNISPWNIRPHSEVPNNASIFIPVGAFSGNKEYPVSDDQLRLLGWVLTDGGITRGKSPGKTAVTIYQRASKLHMVTDILDRMGAVYSLDVRHRKIAAICGRELKKEPELQCEVRLRSGPVKAWILSHLDADKKIPSFVRQLSDRQFGILLQSIIDGDGTRHKSNPDTSLMVYGRKVFLDDLQAACVTHGWRAMLSSYRNGTQWRLNINRNQELSVRSMSAISENVAYDGHVWCTTVPNGTLFTRRNGRVLISGNCAVEHWSGFDPVSALIYQLNQKLPKEQKGHVINHGGYTGFLDYRYSDAHNNAQRFVIWYHHGMGGGAPVTKGMIDLHRTGWVDANVIWLGHKHVRVTSHIQTMHCPYRGKQPVMKDVRQVITGSYFNTYRSQSQEQIRKHGRRSNYAADRGLQPQGMGGMRLIVTTKREGNIRGLEIKTIH